MTKLIFFESLVFADFTSAWLRASMRIRVGILKNDIIRLDFAQ